MGSEAVRVHELGPRTQESLSVSQTTRIGAQQAQPTVGWMPGVVVREGIKEQEVQKVIKTLHGAHL